MKNWPYGQPQNDLLRVMSKPQNTFTWDPTKDTLWIFETNYIDSLKKRKKDFVKKFEKHFGDRNDEFDEDFENINSLDFLPLGFWDGEMRYMADEMIHSFGFSGRIGLVKRVGAVAELHQLADETVETCPEKLHGAIIFKVRGANFGDLSEVGKYLRAIDYCVLGGLISMTHYRPQGSVEQVTLFKYESECG